MRNLRGANAIVTGASRGLGVFIAESLAREGVNLALAARSAEGLEKVCGDVGASGVRVVSIPTDITDRTQLEALVSRVEAELGAIDILVNNAGIEGTHPYQEYPIEEIEQVINVNLTSAMLLTRLVLPGMVERDRGHVVQVASLAGKAGFPAQAPYAATKAAMIMFAHVLRTELTGTNVGSSSVCPGFVADEGMYADMQRDTGVEASRLLGVSKPEKVGEAVVKAIRRNSAELFVNPRPMRPVIVGAQMFPDIIPRIQKAFGVTALAKKMVDALAARDGATGSTPPGV